MHPFKAYISLKTELNEDDWNKISPCLTHKIIQGDRIILKPGEICKNLYFLENGSVRYYTSENGEKLTSYIIQPPFLFTSAKSFTQKVPSIEGIQAVEETYVWVIGREDAYKLLDNPTWSSFISNL